MPAPTPLDDEPSIANHLFLEIDGEVISKLSEVSGVGVEPELADVQQQLSGHEYSQRKAFTRADWTGEITVKRLAPPDVAQDALWKWFETLRNKGMSITSLSEQRKKASVVNYDPTMKEIARWNFYNAWPSKISIDPLDVGGSEPVRETITIQYEKLDRAK